MCILKYSQVNKYDFNLLVCAFKYYYKYYVNNLTFTLYVI